MTLEKTWDSWRDAAAFSGVFSVAGEHGVLFERCRGARNRGEGLANNRDTAFGIASGTKLFTGLAACRLVDKGRLSLDDRLWDILPYDLGRLDRRVTVFQLLTHTSGIGDYLDEEAPDAAEQERALCAKYPVYLWERLDYYLQMITPLPPKFEPGARFGYSNAGYVMLGLAIEAAGGMPYRQFVHDKLILPLGLKHTGFYRADALPRNTALGYIGAPPAGRQRTNIFSLPVIGGADGGLYTCAADLDTLWRAVRRAHSVRQDAARLFGTAGIAGQRQKLRPGRVPIRPGRGPAWYAVGGDFGVDFFTAYFPGPKLTASALGNTEVNTYPLLDALFSSVPG